MVTISHGKNGMKVFQFLGIGSNSGLKFLESGTTNPCHPPFEPSCPVASVQLGSAADAVPGTVWPARSLFTYLGVLQGGGGCANVQSPGGIR